MSSTEGTRGTFPNQGIGSGGKRRRISFFARFFRFGRFRGGRRKFTFRQGRPFRPNQNQISFDGSIQPIAIARPRPIISQNVANLQPRLRARAKVRKPERTSRELKPTGAQSSVRPTVIQDPPRRKTGDRGRVVRVTKPEVGSPAPEVQKGQRGDSIKRLARFGGRRTKFNEEFRF